MENHDSIQRDAEGKLFPHTREELAELVHDDDVHLGSINTSRITDMSFLFSTYNEENKKFDLPERKDYSGIETWDTSHVTDMSAMFDGAASFNEPIGSWDVSHVEDMWCMFAGGTSFNQPLNDWDVSKVKDMTGMFLLAKSFNQPLDSWDVSKVENMSAMFRVATSFNQPLHDWDVSNVESMDYIFNGTASLSKKTLKKTAESWMKKVKHKDCLSDLKKALKDKEASAGR